MNEPVPIDPSDRRAMIAAAFDENIKVLQSIEQTTRLAATYLDDLKIYMEELRAALIEHDIESLRTIIHKTRSGAWWGGDQFLETLKIMGDAARAQDWQSVARYAPRVDNEFHHFSACLDEQIKLRRTRQRYKVGGALNGTTV